jgi:hypothetical protein
MARTCVAATESKVAARAVFFSLSCHKVPRIMSQQQTQALIDDDLPPVVTEVPRSPSVLDEVVPMPASPRHEEDAAEEVGERAPSKKRSRSRSASPAESPCLSPIKRARKVDDKDVATAAATAVESEVLPPPPPPAAAQEEISPEIASSQM